MRVNGFVGRECQSKDDLADCKSIACLWNFSRCLNFLTFSDDEALEIPELTVWRDSTLLINRILPFFSIGRSIDESQLYRRDTFDHT